MILSESVYKKEREIEELYILDVVNISKLIHIIS